MPQTKLAELREATLSKVSDLIGYYEDTILQQREEISSLENNLDNTKSLLSTRERRYDLVCEQNTILKLIIKTLGEQTVILKSLAKVEE